MDRFAKLIIVFLGLFGIGGPANAGDWQQQCFVGDGGGPINIPRRLTAVSYAKAKEWEEKISNMSSTEYNQWIQTLDHSRFLNETVEIRYGRSTAADACMELIGSDDLPCFCDTEWVE